MLNQMLRFTQTTLDQLSHLLQGHTEATGQTVNEDLLLKWGPNEDYFTEKVLMRTKVLNEDPKETSAEVIVEQPRLHQVC